jgi:hypothetical protein
MARNDPGRAARSRQIVWISYVRPEGFDLARHETELVSIQHLSNAADADAWAAGGPGAALAGVVVVATYMPGFHYDPAEILERVKARRRTIPFVIAVRENSLFRMSHYAFTAEFHQICGHGTTVLDADSSGMKLFRRDYPELKDFVDKPDLGISIETRWDLIAREALAIAEGQAMFRLPGSSDKGEEAARLVTAMRGDGALSPAQKRLMVALGSPGLPMQSTAIAAALQVSAKNVTNSYSIIASAVMQEQLGGKDDVDRRHMGASDFCKQLGRDYQDWLMSFGQRHKLLPPEAR